MITLNVKSENRNAKEEKGNRPLRVEDPAQLNLHRVKLEHEQCIKWIYDGEKNYILGYN